jgi:hypothetical protein
MDRDGDIAEVRKAFLEGLKKFAPEILIEQIPTTGYLHVWLISDAFGKYSDLKRMDLIGEVFKRAFADGSPCPQITRLYPLTKAEFAEMFGTEENEPEVRMA